MNGAYRGGIGGCTATRMAGTRVRRTPIGHLILRRIIGTIASQRSGVHNAKGDGVVWDI